MGQDSLFYARADTEFSYSWPWSKFYEFLLSCTSPKPYILTLMIRAFLDTCSVIDLLGIISKWIRGRFHQFFSFLVLRFGFFDRVPDCGLVWGLSLRAIGFGTDVLFLVPILSSLSTDVQSRFYLLTHNTTISSIQILVQLCSRPWCWFWCYFFISLITWICFFYSIMLLTRAGCIPFICDMSNFGA
jgi:hypothetical protein